MLSASDKGALNYPNAPNPPQFYPCDCEESAEEKGKMLVGSHSDYAEPQIPGGPEINFMKKLMTIEFN